MDISDKYEVFWKEAYCGLKNKINGKIILRPIYDVIKIKERWFEVRFQGKAGLAKFNGKYLIEPQFDDIDDFENGYAKVINRKMVGLIHKSGRLVIEPKYSFVGYPSDGLIRVSIGHEFENTKFGFINEMGVEIIYPQYKLATDFNDGLAGVVLKDHLSNDGEYYIYNIGYINRNNKLSFDVAIDRNFSYRGIYGFENTLCRIDLYDEIDHKVNCGFINQTGQKVIKNIYEDFLSPYKKIIPAKKEGKWGIIDFQGFTIFNFIIDEIGILFSNPINSIWYVGLSSNFPVRIGKKWGFIDFKGNVVIPFEYDGFEDHGYFLDNYYILQKKGKWGVVNKLNEIIIPFIYNSIYYSCDSFTLLKVQKGKKWGYIDLNNHQIIKIKYDEVGHFCNNILRVELKGKRGYLDSKGKLLIPLKYTVEKFDYFDTDVNFAFSKYVRVNLKWKYGVIDNANCYLIKPIYEKLTFSEGLWLFYLNSKYGFLDEKGSIKQTNIFASADNFYEGLAAVRESGKWGFIDHDFKLTIPYKFEEVKRFRNGYAAVKNQGFWGFINKKGEQVIECKYEKVFFVNGGMAKCDDYYIDLYGIENNSQYYDYL